MTLVKRLEIINVFFSDVIAATVMAVNEQDWHTFVTSVSMPRVKRTVKMRKMESFAI